MALFRSPSCGLCPYPQHPQHPVHPVAAKILFSSSKDPICTRIWSTTLIAAVHYVLGVCARCTATMTLQKFERVSRRLPEIRGAMLDPTNLKYLTSLLSTLRRTASWHSAAISGSVGTAARLLFPEQSQLSGLMLIASAGMAAGAFVTTVQRCGRRRLQDSRRQAGATRQLRRASPSTTHVRRESSWNKSDKSRRSRTMLQSNRTKNSMIANSAWCGYGGLDVECQWDRG